MNKIEFRAWDKYNEQMHTEVQNADGQPDYKGYDTNNNEVLFQPASFYSYLRDDRFAIMQGTELEDMDGTYIWEGDIATDEDGEIVGVIEKEDGNTYFNWENISEVLSDANNRIRIIGNIFEDEHLLN